VTINWLCDADARRANLRDHSRRIARGPERPIAHRRGSGRPFQDPARVHRKYEIDPAPPTAAGTKVILRAEIASNPLIEGKDRGFFVRVDGNKFIFKTNPPARSPLTGEVSTRNVITERVQ
jgi:hypothetical protein